MQHRLDASAAAGHRPIDAVAEAARPQLRSPQDHGDVVGAGHRVEVASDMVVNRAVVAQRGEMLVRIGVDVGIKRVVFHKQTLRVKVYRRASNQSAVIVMAASA